MLKLGGFITAIHTAIDTAAQAVAKQHITNIGRYFSQDSPQPEGTLPGSKKGDPLGPNSLLRPRMVAMVYPRDTAAGVVEHKVMVPLLSLSPITQLQIEEMNIEIDLEFVEQDGDISVAFPRVKPATQNSETADDYKPNAKLTLKIIPSKKTDGISAIIEGYDKTIRAQIPN